MTGEDARIERIVQELMERPLGRAERIALLRELARTEERIPDRLLDAALSRLLERIAE